MKPLHSNSKYLCVNNTTLKVCRTFTKRSRCVDHPDSPGGRLLVPTDELRDTGTGQRGLTPPIANVGSPTLLAHTFNPHTLNIRPSPYRRIVDTSNSTYKHEQVTLFLYKQYEITSDLSSSSHRPYSTVVQRYVGSCSWNSKSMDLLMMQSIAGTCLRSKAFLPCRTRFA